MREQISIFWFRRDLRLNDNHGLLKALQSGLKVIPIFIFDKNILDKLQDKNDKRVNFIYQQIKSIKSKLNLHDSDLQVFYGNPEDIWNELIKEHNVKALYFNHDYEKYGLDRDEKITNILSQNNIASYSFKDQCIFEKTEVLSGSGTPYTVFSPYARKWKEQMTVDSYKAYESEKEMGNFEKTNASDLISLDQMGFKQGNEVFDKPDFNDSIIANYGEQRDIPAIRGTTRLSVHLRFGTVSIRKCLSKALNSEKWLNELIWRDFYMNILYNFPHINEGKSFRLQYDNIKWRNNETEFEAWCQGKTGFPIVDAGMRELNETGFMHNRVRMIVASFLCKDLLIDWRWGEAYFAQKLLDFDFSANNGGWQWASGSGCDAAPYFRVFNPDSQTLKFDKDLKYIKKWVPELNELNYKPIVDHKMARERALKIYGEGLKN